jgi:hypothetical protein
MTVIKKVLDFLHKILLRILLSKKILDLFIESYAESCFIRTPVTFFWTDNFTILIE